MHGNGRRLQDGFHSCPIAPAQPGLALATRKEGSLIRICIVRPLANTAVTLELSETVGAQASMIVAAAYDAIEQAIRVGDLPGVLEVAAALCSVTLHYDCLRITQSDLLFAAGDTIRFVPVTQDRFDALKHDLATGAIEPHSFLEGE